MAWTPPSDAVETSTPSAPSGGGGWTPPSDAVEVAESAKQEAPFLSRQFFEEGILGRIGKGLGERVGAAMSTPEQNRYVQSLDGPDELSKMKQGAVQGMQRLVSDPLGVATDVGTAVKNTAIEMYHNPGKTTVGFLKSLVQDPEFLLTGGLGAVERAGSLTAKMNKAAQISAKVLASGAEGAGIMAAAETAAQTVERRPYDPVAIGTQAVVGGAFGGAMHGAKEAYTGIRGEKKTATPQSDLPPPPPENATQSEKEAYLEHLYKRREAIKESQPLVETAIRNKETGEIERMGPKHDEARKEATKDTHEQGFVDKEGNFLNRQEAYQRALKTGMLDKTHALAHADEGLHSIDLREAGHEAFQITDEQKAGVPKTDKAPVTREEHKTRIGELKASMYKLDNDLAIAEGLGREEEAKALLQQWRKLSAESTALRKGMPAVQFADKVKPTWEEVHDHLWDVSTVGEAIDSLRTAGVGGKGQQTLLNILGQMELIRDAKFTTHNDHIEYKDSKGVTHKDAMGLYDRSTHQVTLGKDGAVQTFLHEAIHAATNRAITDGKLRSIKPLQKLFDAYTNRRNHEYALLLEQYERDNPNASLRELKDFKNRQQIYGLTDLHEFVSEAFTNAKFMEWMQHTPADTTKPLSKFNSLWRTFKASVAELLDIPSSARTALDETLEHGIRLLQESEGQYRKDGLVRAEIDYALPSKVPTKPTTPEEAAKVGGATTERLRTEPIATPEKPSYKDVKSWDDLIAHGERVLFAEGEEAALKFFDDFKDFKKTWGEHQAGVDKLVHDNIQAKKADERLNVLSNKELEKAITTPEQNKLTRQAIENGKVSSLPDNLRAAAERFKKDLKSYWERANKEGVINGYIENYFPHMLDWVGGPENVGGPKPEPGAMKALINEILGKHDAEGVTNMFGMDVGTKRDLKRSLDTIEDLSGFVNKLNAAIDNAYNKRVAEHFKEKARLESEGKYTGHLQEPTKPFNLKIKTDSIVEAHKIYTHAISKAIANKRFMEGLKDLRDEHGNAAILPVEDGKMPFGWKQIDSPQLAGMAIHPDLEPSLQFLFDAGPGQWMKAAVAVSQAAKRFNVIGSFFHAKSLLEVLNSAKTPIFDPLYHGIVAPLIEQGAKAMGKEIRLSAISKALDQYRKAEFGDSADRWVRQDGLELEVPEDVTQGILTSIGRASDELIGKFGPKTRVLEKSLGTVEKFTLGMFDKYTWDYLHTGIKLHVAESYLAKQKEQAAKSGVPFDEAKARSEIASFVNNAAGGLNWHKAATEAKTEFGRRMAMSAYSPQGRRALQVALFAPDWTLSTIRSFTSALPEKLNPTQWHPVEGIKGMITPTTKADYARLYQFKTALMYFTLVNGINMMTANRPIWENKDPTRIEWPDGTSMQAMKHAMEPYHWIMDPDKTLANKLGFIPKAMVVGMAGVEYASPNAPKIMPQEYTGNTTVDNAIGRVKTVAQSVLPFQVQAAKGAPAGEGAKRAVLGTLGFPVYGSTAEQKKLARKERTLAEKENSWRYHQKEIEAGRERPTQEHTRKGRMLKDERRKLESQKARE